MLDTPRSTPADERTQASRRAESSKRLLLAAAALVAEKGFEKTTAAEIGERAGYSRAMVRARYGSKEALIEALFRDELEPRVNAHAVEGKTGLERVLGQVDTLERFVLDDEVLARSFFVLTFEAAGPIPSLRPWYRGYFTRYTSEMRDNLLAGIEDGSVRADVDPDEEAAHFVTHALGLAFRWSLDWNGFDYLPELSRWRARLERTLRRPKATGQ